MYLKRVVINGFKSFGARTVVDFEPGVSAIVGPNGAGKSNVVEAIRWALGEQSARQLRSGGREELIFGGTEGRPKASMAEVVLVFDNADGAFQLEVEEVEVGRRLYRSGESGYRVMQRPARLADVQALLAEAGLAADSFAVVGQGTIDAVLLAGPAERALMFEEASGIRGLELKRQAAERKLEVAAGNTQRLRDLAAELEPRLKQLEKVAELAARRQELLKQLGQMRRRYLAAVKHQLEHEGARRREQTAQLEREKRGLERQVARLEAQAAELRNQAAAARRQSQSHQDELARLQGEQSAAGVALSDLRVRQAELEAQAAERGKSLQAAAAARRQQTALERKLAAKQKNLEKVTEQAAEAADRIEQASQRVAKVSRELAELPAEQLGEAAQQQIRRALRLLKMAARYLDAPDFSASQLRLVIHKAGRFLAAADRPAESHNPLGKLQTKLERLMHERETVSEHHTNLVIAQRSLELDVAALQAQLAQAAGAAADYVPAKQAAEQGKARLHELAGEVRRAERRLAEAQAALAQAAETPAAPDLAEALEVTESLGQERLRLQELESLLAGLRAAEAAEAALLAAAEERRTQWGLDWPEPAGGNAAELAARAEQLGERAEALAGLSDGEQEYALAEVRLREIHHQVADLERAEADLRGLVQRLSLGMEERFKTGFTAINRQFARCFQDLFGGGSAGLVLVDLPGGHGIDVSVTVPGKRSGSLSRLSGGERALTGVALLLALLSQSRSPFIVLDEVDAALDEANSERLAVMLARMGQAAQLIAVTHNRQTMAAAANLYGVTLDRHQVSRVVSLKLDQARQLAARG